MHYESARGCPYRCAFCNYPFLFDDTKFRYRSAARIARDWQQLAARGAEIICCLDSLFTMPKRRLQELCRLLIERQVNVRWICYARADDLASVETCQMMREAGCLQVQIGLESGSQTILDNMGKRSTVEQSARALENCRRVGITTITTVIIGFPGETKATLEETLALLKQTPPDFYYAAPLNTRIEYIPMLSPESRARFGMTSAGGNRSSAPYWAHTTMSCIEVGDLLRWFHDRMTQQRVALEGTLFYPGILGFDAKDRDALLDFQRDVAMGHPMIRRVFKWLAGWARRRLERDVRRTLPAIGKAPADPFPSTVGAGN